MLNTANFGWNDIIKLADDKFPRGIMISEACIIYFLFKNPLTWGKWLITRKGGPNYQKGWPKQVDVSVEYNFKLRLIFCSSQGQGAP